MLQDQPAPRAGCRRLAPFLLAVALMAADCLLASAVTVPRLAAARGCALIGAAAPIVLVSLAMHLWGWAAVVTADPGRVADDLARRGLLAAVLREAVPASLAHLPVCPWCRVPAPPLCRHCARCRACFLRHCCHLRFCGRCVADRTFKPFVLSLLWGALAAVVVFSLHIGLVIGLRSPWPLLPGIYAGAYFTVAVACAFAAVLEGWTDVSFYDRALRRAGRRVTISEVWRSFGSVWWRRFIPAPTECTQLAWPGVDWRADL
jgi:hypothetical protein